MPLIFIIGIFMGSLGAILMKIGARNIGYSEINSISAAFDFLVRIIANIPLMSGMFIYFITGLLWAYLLTKLDISYVQPILALTYVLTPILAILILQEHVSYMRWAGILIIVIGVFIVARSASV